MVIVAAFYGRSLSFGVYKSNFSLSIALPISLSPSLDARMIFFEFEIQAYLLVVRDNKEHTVTYKNKIIESTDKEHNISYKS